MKVRDGELVTPFIVEGTATLEKEPGGVWSGGSSGSGNLRMEAPGLVVRGRPLAHTGTTLIDRNATLDTPNELTGRVDISADVFANDADAFGTSVVVVDDGFLQLNAEMDNRIDVGRRAEVFSSINHTGQVRLTSGGDDSSRFSGEVYVVDFATIRNTVEATLSGPGRIEFAKPGTTPLKLDKANLMTGRTVVIGAGVDVDHEFALGTLTGPTLVGGSLINLNVVTQEPITLTSGGRAAIKAPIERLPIIANRTPHRNDVPAEIDINGPLSFDETPKVENAVLRIDANVGLAGLELLDDGVAMIANGRSLDVMANDVLLSGGSIQRTITGADIRKISSHQAHLENPREFTGEVIVNAAS